MISSLSSGITNTKRDANKFTFAIVTYAWLVDHIALVSIEPYWLAVFIAFLDCSNSILADASWLAKPSGPLSLLYAAF